MYKITENDGFPEKEDKYLVELKKFEIFRSQKGFKSWSDLTQHDVRDFISGIRRNGTSPRSLARLLSSLRSFYKFLNNYQMQLSQEL